MGWRGFGFVHHSRTLFCRAVPNPNITIRIFCIAVSQRDAKEGRHALGDASDALRRAEDAAAGARKEEVRWRSQAAAAEAEAERLAAACEEQVRFCRDRFSPTGELGYRGAVGLGYRSTV
jgi:hypothetical protein